MGDIVDMAPFRALKRAAGIAVECQARRLANASQRLLSAPERGWHVLDVPDATIWVEKETSRFVSADGDWVVAVMGAAVVIDGDTVAAAEWIGAQLSG